MAKKLNTVQVNMQFNTDTHKAKQQIQELQNSLTKLLNSPAQINIDASKIREATIATTELQAHLKNATNVDTGNLDFSKLSQSLKKSGKTLQEYGDQLRNLGPQGQQAFMQLTQAVVSAEVPIKRTNALLKEFANTLANTARWQISSSIIHGFTGALQSAYGYAQDLNESLNNIRIVTGRSVDDMADFAKEANKAAKALSTTTTKYTDASLIYYQQGLKDEDVKKRADVTVKLANVSRQSAQEVSEQMTAIWNNFADGSRSLEHYADVLSALGAATASSTEEIAGGLEKFAAVADTIGLSYEYAAAALATITSNTRQSEEVVGTALKTIFARIQGLNLGETLEDGTTLNKYSEALDKVGVNIYDANKQLKDMDTILNELGGKWNSLGKDQQVALAQTVAGVRQYNQLIALMDNWNKGDSDSFMTNLSTANNAAGELNKQADIYAEGWEAAADRVTAAAEAIYDSLIDDEFFVDLLNNVEKLLGFVNNLIESLGGLKGVLFALGTVVTKVFSQQMAQGLTNLAYNIKMSSEGGRKQIQQEKSKFIEDAAVKMAKSADSGEAGYDQKEAAKLYEQQLLRQQELIDNADKMSEIEKETVKSLMEQLKLRDELSIKSAAELQKQRNALDTSAALIYSRGADTAAKKHRKYNPALITEEMAKIKAGMSAADELQKLLNSGAGVNPDTIAQIFAKINGDTSKGWNIVAASQIPQIKELSKGIDELGQDTEEYRQKVQILSGVMERVNEKIQQHAVEITGATADEVKRYATNVERVARATEEQAEAAKQSKKANEDLRETIKKARGAQKTWADTLVSTANFALSATTAISMLSGAVDKLKDPDVSGWEKFITILTTVSMIIPTLINLWTSFKDILNEETIAKLANAGATIAQAQAEKALNKEKGVSSDTTKENIAKTVTDTAKKGGETGKNGFKNIKTFISEKKSAYDQSVWDGLDENARQKYRDQAMQKYTKNLIPDKNNPNHLINPKTGDITVKTALESGQKSNIINANAMKAAGTKSLGSMAGGVALIVAGIAVAVGAITWGIAQFNKYSKAAEEAAKIAEDAALAYERVAEAYNSFKTNTNDYTNAINGLKDLTKGTLEYKEAVIEANSVAQELINQGNLQLGVDYEIDSDGLIQIKEDSLRAAQELKMNNAEKAQINKQIASINAQEAKTKSDTVDLLRKDIKSTSGAWANFGNIMAATGTGAGSGALIGTGIGTIVPVIGNAIGAAVGAIGGGLVGLATGIIGATKSGSASEREKAAIDAIAEAYATGKTDNNGKTLSKNMSPEEYEAFLRNQLKIDDDKLIKSLVENRDEIEELCLEMEANTEATKALNQQIAASALSDNKAVQGSQYKDEIVATVGNTFEEDKQRELDALSKQKGWDGSGINAWSGKNNKTARDLLKEYAEAAGLGDIELTDIKGTDKKRKFVYKDAEGKEHTVDLNTMKDVVAANKASETADERGTKLAKIYNNFSEKEMAVVNAAVNKNYANLTAAQMKAGFSNISAQSLKLSAEDLIAMGYTEEEFNKAIQNASQNVKDDWNKTLSLHTTEVDKVMNTIVNSTDKTLSDISYNAIKAYGNMLETINSDETDNFNNALTNIMKANSDRAEEIMNIASNIDWTKGTSAISDFNYQLLQIGININENDEIWKQFTTAVNNINVSVLSQDLNSIRDSLADIENLSSDLEIGDIISDEDYDRLLRYNAELEKYFIMTADGYKYVGSTNIEDMTGKSSEEMLENILNINKRAREAAAAFSSIYWNDGSYEDWYGLADGTDADWQLRDMAYTMVKNANLAEHVTAVDGDANKLREWADVLNDQNATTEQKNNAREQLKNFYSKIIDLQNKVEDYSDEKAFELIASRMSLNELENADYIDKDTKDKIIPYLQEAANKDRDIFRDVNNELEDIQHNLSLVDKLKENAYGPDKLDLIAKETQLLENQVQTLKENKGLLSTALGDTQTKLSNDYSWLQFDADGNISNYDDLYKYLKEDQWKSAKEAFAEYEELQRKAQDNELELLDLRNQIQAKTLETYAAADDALEKYNNKLEHHTKTLGHYKDLLVLTGRETDYDNLGIILGGEASVLKDTLASSTEQYKMYDKEVTRWADEMKKVKEGSDEWKIYHQNWENAQEKSREAQDKMLSDLQAWAEAEKAIVENTLADLGKDLEKALTGGLSFDQLNTQMERAASLQEEYLTSTNQIYETTKLMRTAQQEIDKSTNTVAKQKMKNFINETKALQDQGKLSKFELELQQAKYDLLVAEIALEEAQNAKSTVRLQRDSEGNFGYVYTADAALVNESLQQFDDAQNALYNKGLEGANSYAQKQKSTMQEMTEALAEINTNYLNGMYESEEEYHNAILATKDHYYQKLNDYSKLYSIAIETDSEIAATAWSTEFSSMVKDTKEWQESVNTYISGSGEALKGWKDTVKSVYEVIGLEGGTLDTLATKVNGIKTASSELVTALTGENGLVSQLKTGFGEVAKTITDAINKFEDLSFDVSIKANGSIPPSDNSVEGDQNSTSPPSVSPNEDTNNSSTESSSISNNADFLPGSLNVNTTTGTVESPLTNDLAEKYGIAGVDMYKYKIIGGKIYSGFTKEAPDFYRAFNLWDGWSNDKSLEENTIEWFKTHYVGPATLDTGGYTGEWGPEGKMAMLHEKEIVLNQQDTENFLMAIDMLDNILATIDSYAMNQMIGGFLRSPDYGALSTETLEQNVHIEASFPGVTDRNEIEEAFNNLVNKASQYANRK